MAKKRVQQIVESLVAIDKQSTIKSIAAFPGADVPHVVVFTDDAKITLSPNAAFNFGKHLIDMSTIAKGVLPDIEDQGEVWSK